MVAHTYRELVAWQLAMTLRDQTIAIIPTNPRLQDRKLFDQLRSSVDSAADNIAEGFGRFEPVDFARFLSIASASLDEADIQLRKAVTCGALTADQAAPRLTLAARCRAAALGLRRYLLGPGRDYAVRWKARQRN